MTTNSRLIAARTLLTALALACFACHSQAVVAPENGSLTNLDKRITGEPKAALAPERASALNKVLARIPDIQIDFDDIVGSPNWIRSRKGFLSRPLDRGGIIPPQNPRAQVQARAQADDPHEPAKQFLDRHAELFEHGAEVLQDARITREFVGAHNGMRTVVWEQRLDDIPVFQSVLIAHITKNGELVNLSSLFLPKPDQAAKLDRDGRLALAAAPPITARQAVVEASKSIGQDLKLDDVTALDAAANDPKAVRKLAAPSLSREARAELVWLPISRSEMRLCWKVQLGSRKSIEMFLVLIDAQSGEDLLRHCLTVYANETEYHVFTSDSPSPFPPGHSYPTNVQPSTDSRGTRTWSALDTESVHDN